jgi:hypothetical protein
MLAVAHERAQAAVARAAAAREASAVAHQRAATLNDQLATSGQGDVGDTGGSRNGTSHVAEADRGS